MRRIGIVTKAGMIFSAYLFLGGCAMSEPVGTTRDTPFVRSLAALKTKVALPEGRRLVFDRKTGERLDAATDQAEIFEVWAAKASVEDTRAKQFIFESIKFYPETGLWPVTIRDLSNGELDLDWVHLFPHMEEYFGNRKELYEDQTWTLAETEIAKLMREDGRLNRFQLYLIPTTSPLAGASGFMTMDHYRLLPFASYPMGPVFIDGGLPFFIVPDRTDAVIPQKIIEEVSLAIGDEPEPDDILTTRVFPFYYTN